MPPRVLSQCGIAGLPPCPLQLDFELSAQYSVVCKGGKQLFTLVFAAQLPRSELIVMTFLWN